MSSEITFIGLSEEAKQQLRLRRHLMGIAAGFFYNLMLVYLYYKGYFAFGALTFIVIFSIFWAGNFSFTRIFRTGSNLRFQDPSMTLGQLFWAATFILIPIYTYNDVRSVLLMSFFVTLSFGFFRLTFIQFVSIAAYAVFGYIGIIFYLYVYEPARINIDWEIAHLIGFSMTSLIMVYTGTAVSRLREANRIKTLRLEEALELNTRLATTDDLTGLSTRRYFMDILNKQKAIVERDNADFVICFADLDHFKYINDSYGHHVGDEVLKVFSGIIRSSIREIDYACRFGGEEFVILLVNTDVEKSRSVAERIRRSIEFYNFNDIAPALNVTVSIGIANYQEHKSVQQTLMSADNKMYTAKERGRNQVIL